MGENRYTMKDWLSIIKSIESIKDVYTRASDIISMCIAKNVRYMPLLFLKKRMDDKLVIVLDVGSGPGDSAYTAWRTFGKNNTYVIALDPSSDLIKVAMNKQLKGCLLCEAVEGVAEHLPFRTSSIDVVQAFFSARDFYKLNRALLSMIAVSRKWLVIGDIFSPSNSIKRLILLLWVCKFVPLIVETASPGHGRYYKSLCNTLNGWMGMEELSSVVRVIAKYLNKPINSFSKKNYIMDSLGYIIFEF